MLDLRCVHVILYTTSPTVIYHTVFSPNLRKYFFPAGMQQSVPSRSGIALRLPEWEALKARVAELMELKPELVNVGRCSDQEDHQNQIGYFNCGECNHLPPDFVPW